MVGVNEMHSKQVFFVSKAELFSAIVTIRLYRICLSVLP